MDVRLGLNSDRVVTVHMGKQQFIEIESLKIEDRDKFLTLRAFQDEFGRAFQNFIGDEFKYIYRENQIIRYNIPTLFMKRAGIEKNGFVRVLLLSDGRVIIAPTLKKCAFDGEVIEPILQKEEKIDLCEDCGDSTDKLVQLFDLAKKLTKMTISMQETIMQKDTTIKELKEREKINARNIEELQMTVNELVKRYPRASFKKQMKYDEEINI